MAKLTLAAALAALDPHLETHWTEDGLPRLDLLSTLTGAKVTREQATSAAPGLTRASKLSGAEQAPQTAPAGVGAVTVATAVPAAPQGGGNGVQQPTAGGAAAEQHAGGEDGQAEVPESPFDIARREYNQAVAVKAQADRDVAEKGAALDRLIEARDKSAANSTLDDAVRAYHASQLKDRQRRAEQIAALKGVDLKSILPQRSPIDQAFKSRPRR